MQLFRVFIPPAAMPTPLRQMDMGSLTSAHTYWERVIRTHEGGSGTNKSAQLELTRCFFLRSFIGGGSVCDRF